MTTKRMAAMSATLGMLAGLRLLPRQPWLPRLPWLRMLPGRRSPATRGRTARSVRLATAVALAGLAGLGLAACGGGSDDGLARTYQSVALPMDLTLDQLTEEQQASFCSWINDPANQSASDPTQAGTPPAVVNACLAAFTTYPLCTVGQYDACGRASFADPNGATPDACKAIDSCPVTPQPQFDLAPPSRVCDGVMMPGSARWCDADGTAKDMTTGLVWLKNAACGDALGISQDFPNHYGLTLENSLRWAAALSTYHCSLLDGSAPGNWALPSETQINTLIRGVERVSDATPRLFNPVPSPTPYCGYGTHDYQCVFDFFWTATPEGRGKYWSGGWVVLGFTSNPDDYRKSAKPAALFAALPVRQTLLVTSATSINAGLGYSIAPASALNPAAGTSYYTRSYLTSNPAVTDYTAAHVALSAWDNVFRTPRIWYFDADPDNAGYYRVRYAASGGPVRYLLVEGNSTNPGAAVVGWPDAGGDNRRWKPEFVDGGVMLKSKLSGLCMHIETNDGLFLRQATCDATNKAQVFVLTPRQDG